MIFRDIAVSSKDQWHSFCPANIPIIDLSVNDSAFFRYFPSLIVPGLKSAAVKRAAILGNQRYFKLVHFVGENKGLVEGGKIPPQAAPAPDPKSTVKKEDERNATDGATGVDEKSPAKTSSEEPPKSVAAKMSKALTAMNIKVHYETHNDLRFDS